MLMMGYIFGAAFVVACIFAGASILWVVFYSVKMSFQLSNSKDAFSRKTLWNPMNAIFNPGLLSQKGLVSRKQVFRGAMVFVLSLAVAGCIAGIFQFIDKVS